MSGEGPDPDFLRTFSDEIDTQIVRRSKSYMGGPEKVRAAGILRTFSGLSPDFLRTFSGHCPDIVRTFSGPSPDLAPPMSDEGPDPDLRRTFPALWLTAADQGLRSDVM